MKQSDLTRAELEALHSVLRRACERAEAEKRAAEAAQLAEELANLEHEIERAG